MKTTKKFDCVRMKDAIQAKMRKEHQGLNDEQIAARLRRKLARSNRPIAKLWRAIGTPTGRGK